MENTAIISMTGKDIVKANIIANRTGNAFVAGYLLSLGNELRKRMQEGVVEFYFRKKNAEIRKVYGTTMPALAKSHIKYGGSPISVITFWDTEKGDWRCCQLQSLIKVC